MLHTVLRPVGMKRFVVLPKRWIVERTFAWLARYRRHARDYERTTQASETVTYIAMINLRAVGVKSSKRGDKSLKRPERSPILSAGSAEISDSG